MKVKNNIFALIDCNNFYCSCERVFNPALEKRGVVVLSNNDGCIVARSQEVKDLKIPMAAPYFQYKNILKQNNVKVFSSNYQLYGDMSARIMNILTNFCPEIEFYSIDEAFVKLNNIANINYEQYCLEIANYIKKCTSIPVSIGIGPTKTLAKIANFVAKKTAKKVVSLIDEQKIDHILKKVAIEDVWGVGKNLALKLRKAGIYYAYDLKKLDTMWARKYLTVVGERMVRELNSISCLEINHFSPKKNIISSKSFGQIVHKKEFLQQSLASYGARACQKLRNQNGKVQAISIFIRTNKFRLNDRQYYNGCTQSLDIATDDSSKIIKLALKLLDSIYIDGLNYHKAGIILHDIISKQNEQTNLFADIDHEKRSNLMKIIDNINYKSGKETIFFAQQGVNRIWSLKSDHSSPRYTTNWHEIPSVIA